MQAIGQVAVGDEPGMFPCHEEQVAEALLAEVAGFTDDLIGGESDAEDGVISGEAAVLAVVDALVGEVEGREEADDFAESLLSQLLGTLGQQLQNLPRCGGDQLREISQCPI